MRVLVVEDDGFTRSTLCASLELEGHTAPMPAGNASEALRSFAHNRHDVLLVDLDLGDGPSGIELAWMLRATAPNLGVVILTSYEDPRLHRRQDKGLPTGCQYLVKQDISDRKQIVSALEKAIGSSREIGEALHPIGLTEIQIETLRLISQGKTNAEIAQIRFVTEKAVEQTIKRIIEVLHLSETGNQRVSLSNAFLRLTGGKN